MKKILSLLFVLAILLTSSASLAAHAEFDVRYEKNYFTDVVNNSWYESGVLYCYKYGYMSGVGESIFNPNGNCTRAMFATVLYNVSMATDTYSKMSFKDVPLNTWYSNPVEWAFQKEYTYGVAEGYFAPNNNLSRQELVTLLYRYHLANTVDVTVSGDVSSFKDAASVSDWAKESLNWAIGEGIISGFEDGTLRPKGLVTRAQLASILKRYLEVYGIDWVNETIQAKRLCTSDGISVFTDSTGKITKTVVYKAWHTYRFDSVTQKYDCVYGEKSKYKCSECGATKIEVSRKGSGKHNWDNGIVLKGSTIFEDGETRYTCRTCGGKYTKKVKSGLIGTWNCKEYLDCYGNSHNLSYSFSATIKSSNPFITVKSGTRTDYHIQTADGYQDPDTEYYTIHDPGDGTLKYKLAYYKSGNYFILSQPHYRESVNLYPNSQAYKFTK